MSRPGQPRKPPENTVGSMTPTTPGKKKVIRSGDLEGGSGHSGGTGGVIKRKIIVRRRASCGEMGRNSSNPVVPAPLDEFRERAKSEAPCPHKEENDQTNNSGNVVSNPAGEIPSGTSNGRAGRFLKKLQAPTLDEPSEAPPPQVNEVAVSVPTEAPSEEHEIQKRLKEAGITDEQYRAMLAAGLSITIA